MFERLYWLNVFVGLHCAIGLDRIWLALTTLHYYDNLKVTIILL